MPFTALLLDVKCDLGGKRYHGVMTFYYFGYYDISHPDGPHAAVTDLQDTLGRFLTSSLQNDLYLILTHSIRNKVAEV